jgi:AcrR family transcriptional regulator
MSTRDKILKEALNLFSTTGVDSVSVRDIAYTGGIKESSLYNHFKNKQDIFDSILSEYSGRWEEIFKSINLTGEDKAMVVDERTVNMYRGMSQEQFTALAALLFDYYMTDEINVKLRRMLTIEQYRNEDIAILFRKISFNDSLEFQAMLFKEFMEQGSFIKADPYLLAMEFFSPIFMIFYKFGNDPESLREAKSLFIKHIEHFNSMYTVKEGKADK